MRVVVLVPLHFEGAALGLQLDGDAFIHAQVLIATLLHRLGVALGIAVVFGLHVFPCEVAHFRLEAPLQVDQGEGADAVLLGNAHVVRAKTWRGVYHAGAVLGGHEVAGDHLEGIAVGRLCVGHELLIADAFQLCALEFAIDGPRDVLSVLLVVRKGGVLVLLVEVGGHTRLGQHHGLWLVRVGVEALDPDVVQLGAHGERGIAG